ncbi:YtxH domain-containing protein [Kocuria sp. U4B]
MNDQHPVPVWGFFFLAGLGLAGTLGAMIGPAGLFAGLLIGAVLGGVLEVFLAPLRPDAQSLLEHES